MLKSILLISSITVLSLIHANVIYAQSNIVDIEIPENLSIDNVINPDSATKKQLNILIKQEIKRRTSTSSLNEGVENDYIINFTKNGQDIFSENRLKQNSQKKHTDQETDIIFTFNSVEWPWSEAEIDSMQSWLSDLYPAIKKIYGNPIFNDTINIEKDSTISGAGYYAGSYIVLWSSSALPLRHLLSPLVHEIIHSFHNSHCINFSSYEEGMTRAAEVEVFQQNPEYINPYTMDHSYCYDVFYEAHNKRSLVGRHWSLGSFTLLRYQLAGYAFAKAYIEDNNFFINFNKIYYANIQQDLSYKNDENKLKEIFRQVKPTMENQNFSNWYSDQCVLNNSDTLTGDFLYTRYLDDKSFIISYFNRDERRFEHCYSNFPIKWGVYDCNDKLIDDGICITNDYGNIDVFPVIPDGYIGKIKLIAKADSPSGIIRVISFGRSINYYFDKENAGVFGLVSDRNEGIVTIKAMNDLYPDDSVKLKNGIFSFPAYKNLKGSFQITYISPTGKKSSRIFTKDASHYFVELSSSGILESKENILMQNFPNPFTSETLISFKIEKPEFINLSIYDTNGNLIKTLINGLMSAGESNIMWNADDLSGGLYYYKMEFNGYSAVKKCILIK